MLFMIQSDLVGCGVKVYCTHVRQLIRYKLERIDLNVYAVFAV